MRVIPHDSLHELTTWKTNLLLSIKLVLDLICIWIKVDLEQQWGDGDDKDSVVVATALA